MNNPDKILGLKEGKRVRQETIYFNFRLDIGGTNLNHVNQFILLTKLTKENEIPEKMKSQPTLSKTFRKSKEINVKGLSSVLKTSIESCIIERVCNIILFLIAINWFSSYWFPWSNGLVVRALDCQSRGPRFKTIRWLQSRLSLSSFRGRSNEY